MEHLKITKVKIPRKKQAHLESMDFVRINEYWKGACLLIPDILKLLPNKHYVGCNIIGWYDKIVIYHDKKMNEFNKLFSWQKK